VLLAVDVSNTATAVGLFRGAELVAAWRIGSETRRTSDDYGLVLTELLRRLGCGPEDVEAAALCSVVPALSRTLARAVVDHVGVQPLVVGPGVRTGIRILTDNPREVGPDRVTGAVAAHRLYGGPVIVADFGTATTFDAISAGGDYLGAVIAPGLEMSVEALAREASLLQGVELARPRQAIGKSTAAALQAGIVFGFADLTEGVVARMRAELGGRCRVVATGAFAEVVRPEAPSLEVVEPHLTLHGLRLIHELNAR
jgi:type III pantothenate kinase